MSNAMRTGKRWLAGVAVTALGAGLLTFVGASPGQATTGTWTPSVTGITIITPDDTAGVANVPQTSIPIYVSTLDAVTGLPDNLATNETLTATVLTPGGAVGTAATSFGLDDSVGTGTPGFSAVALTNVTTGVYGLTLNPRNAAVSTGAGTGVRAWGRSTTAGDSAIAPPAGNYTVRLTLTNTNTGAVQTKNIDINVLAPTSRPTPSFTWLSGTANGPLVTRSVNNQVGAVAGETAQAQFVRMVDGNGYPIVAMSNALAAAGTSIITPSVVTTSGTGVATTATATVTSGFASAGSTSGTNAALLNNAPGIYSTGPTAAWAASGVTGAYRLTFTNTAATVGALPVVFGVATRQSAAVTAAVTNRPIDAAAAPPQIPSGTTPVTFTVSPTTVGDTMVGTLAWNVRSTGGGTVTPSGGVASISGNTATIVVAADAVASADLSSLVLSLPATAQGAWTLTGQTEIAFADAAPVISVPATQVAKLASAVPYTGTLLSQFGQPLTGSWSISVSNPAGAVVASTSTVGADGAFTVDIPATSSPATASAVTYTFRAVQGTVTAQATSTVTYNATGGITSLTVVTSPVTAGASVPALVTPGSGTLGLGTVSTAIVNPASASSTIPAGADDNGRITSTTSPATAVTYTAPAGVYLSTSIAGNVAWNGGLQTLTVGSGTPVSIWTTKVGLQTIQVAAGDKTSTVQVYGYAPANTARNLELTPDKAEVDRNTFTNFTLKVTDVFGNPVPNVAVGTAAQAQGVTVALSGGGTIPPIATTTGAAGTLTIAYTAPNASGTAQLQAVGAGAEFASTIAGASAAKSTAASVITVRGEAPTRSILIVGERTTVSGKSGILVEGSVRGIENGKTVKPFIRFPGETTFTEGSARPVIEGGDFTWQRKTGKRVTVYVTSDDGAVVSNRVTIQAS